MSVVAAALMCHAPIVIPDVAGARARQVHDTAVAMRAAAARVVAASPDVVVVTSPHTPRSRGQLRAIAGPLRGDFGRFGAPAMQLRYAFDAAIHEALCASPDVVSGDPEAQLDHGAFVPLWFLHEAGYRGPVNLVAFSAWRDLAQCARFGTHLAQLAQKSGRRIALIASGDMSHRLIPGAPAGHHKNGAVFDAAFTAAVQAGQLDKACALDGPLSDDAAEDVIDSVAVARAVLSAQGHQPTAATGYGPFTYQGPFGVGYLVGMLRDSPSATAAGGEHE